MCVIDDRFWAVTGANGFIHEINEETGVAENTYQIAGNTISARFQGIARKDDRLIYADYLKNYLRIFEIELP